MIMTAVIIVYWCFPWNSINC